jgi:ATP-dependent DNA helicase RecG
MVLHGRIVDPAYSRVLIQRTDLPLLDVIALDRVQKGLPLEEDAVRRLKRAKLIEGRKPHYHVSAAIASAADTKAAYIKTRALDDDYYRKLVTEYLEKFGSATRADLIQLLRDKLSDALDDSQKEHKISNLTTNMRRRGIIRNAGARKTSKWVLTEKNGAG